MKTILHRLVAAGVLAMPAVSLAEAKLIADINSYHGNPQGNFEDAPPSGFISTADKLFFRVDDGIHGQELWATDGTAVGTALVKDLWPGPESGFGPGTPTLAFGNELYFSAPVPGATGTRLWRSDGTTNGTALVHNSVQPASLVAFAGHVWFLGREGDGNYALWRSDGSSAGTVQVAMTQDSGIPAPGQDIRVVGEKLFFISGAATKTLWVSDGSNNGTRQILRGAQILPRAELHAQDSGVLLFSYRETSAQNQAELWRSNGELSGTFVISADMDFSQGRALTGDNQAFLHIGNQLIRSDGSQAGSYTLASNLVEGDSFEGSPPWLYLNGKLFYVGDGSHGDELWSADPNAQAAALVKDINPGAAGSDIADMDILNGQLIFTAFREGTGFALWASDGSEIGTVLLADPNPATDHVGNCWCGRTLTVAAGDAYFSSYQPSVGTELWRYQGSSGRTNMIRDITSGGTSTRFGEQFSFNDRIVFSSSGTDNPLELLWISDGSLAGTQLLGELKSVNDSSDPYLTLSLGNGMILAATNTEVQTVQAGAVDKSYEQRTPRVQLYRLMDNFSGLDVVFANENNSTQPFRPVYSAETSVLRWGSEYLSSDGGPAAVQTLDQEAVHETWYSAYANGFRDGNPQDGTTMYYLASGELWATDGSAPTTRMIVDAADLPAPQNSIVVVKLIQGRLHFATTGLENDRLQRVWQQKADGRFQMVFEAVSSEESVQDFAASDTQLFVVTDAADYRNRLYSVDPSDNSSRQLLLDITGQISAAVPLGDKLIFLAAQGEVTASPPPGTTVSAPPIPPYTYIETDGAEPWVSDGSPQGTRLLLDVHEGPQSSNPSAIHELGDRVVFAANDGIHGNELWETDGTTAGTRLITDIYPGIASGLPREGASELAIFDGTLIFQATSGEEGLELWRSDGTRSGTVLTQDIHPGPGSSSPQGFTAHRQHLVFVANDGLTGREPWFTPISAIIPMDFGDAPNERYPTMLANNGARHRVGDLYLGDTIDAEIDAWQDSSSIANGDDVNGGLDEDGVEIQSLSLDAGEGLISVTISQPGRGKLDGWIDLNQDGDWEDAGEQVLRRAALSSKVNQIRFPLPRMVGDDDGRNNSSLSGETFARFRLSSGGALQPLGVQANGITPDGEVEDYLVWVDATAPPSTPTPSIESPTATPQPTVQPPAPTIQSTPSPAPTTAPTSEPVPTQQPAPTAEPVTAEAEGNSADAEGSSGSGLVSPWLLLLGLMAGLPRRAAHRRHAPHEASVSNRQARKR